MTEEFVLSEKIGLPYDRGRLSYGIHEKYVKEFLEREGKLIEKWFKELLKKVRPNYSDFWFEKMLLPLKIKRSILAGDKLTK